MKLEQQVWQVANDIRSKTGGQILDVKNYLVSLLFYKFLDDKQEAIMVEDTAEGISMEEIKEDFLFASGYWIEKEDRVSGLINAINSGTFTLSTIEGALDRLTESSRGENEVHLHKIFEGVDVHSSFLGGDQEKRTKILASMIRAVASLEINGDFDVFGRVFEYLINKFAENGGKAGGEHYTPAEVCDLMAEIVTEGVDRVKVYDPTCGSGGLLNAVVHKVGRENLDKAYGQELNAFTYHLAKMNMMMHGLDVDKFKLHLGNTLTEEKLNPDDRFNCIVANPPYGVKYEPTEVNLTGPVYGNLPKRPSKANGEMLFVWHMLHHLDDNGKMAVILPTGPMYRTGGEGKIREYLVSNNLIEKVIYLPENIFYGTSIETVCLVLNKNKTSENIHMVDARDKFKTVGKLNVIIKEDIQNDPGVVLSKDTIANKEYSLDIAQYIKKETKQLDTFKNTLKEINQLQSELEMSLNLKQETFELDMSNFKEFKIKDIVEYGKRSNLTKKAIAEIPGEYPVIGGGKAPLGFIDNFNLEGGWTTISSRGTVGYVAWHSDPFWASGNCHPVRSKDEEVVLNKFLYYMLKEKENRFATELSRGTAVLAFNKTDLMNEYCNIPSIEIQQALVTKWDAIAKTQAQAQVQAQALQEKLSQLLLSSLNETIPK